MSPSAPLFVGVDGGGTGCRARIEDADHVGSPVNLAMASQSALCG